MDCIFIDKRKVEMANKDNPKGYYLCKIGYFDIRLKVDLPNKTKSGTSQVFIYHGKHKVGGPFKAKEAAVIRAEEMMSEGVRYSKHGKK